jgi:hypothetical protein
MVNISRSTNQVCGMMSNKADATHQAMNRYDQLSRTRESLCYALGYEPSGPDDHTGESRCYTSGWTQGKRVDTCSRPIYIKKEEVFCTQRIELVK